MISYKMIFFVLAIVILVPGCNSQGSKSKEPIDLVNPYMGNISHLLVPTYPTIHLPNSLLRVYPDRGDYTGSLLKGLPLVSTSHRGSFAFNLSPFQGSVEGIKPVISFAQTVIKMDNGKKFKIIAQNSSEDNKYIQSVKLNGREWNKPWFSHDDIKEGGELNLVMSNKPNYSWGANSDDSPPSMSDDK